MTSRCAGLLILTLSLAAATGCSRRSGAQQPPPPTSAKTPEPKPAPPKKPEPVVEPDAPVQYTLPDDGGAWPWSVGQVVPPPESMPVAFPGLAPFAVTGFAVRPEVSRAVITIRAENKKGQTNATTTRVALCDTASGTVLNAWMIPGLFTALDLSPDGRMILATGATPGKERGTLYLWMVGSDEQLQRWALAPHTATRADGMRTDGLPKLDAVSAVEVKWAGFVGTDRIVSVSRNGQLRVLDTDGLRHVGGVDGSPCRPAVTPDGSKVAFLAGSSVALFDPTAGKVVGTRWIGTAPPHPVLAFSPDGAKLAVGGNGKALLLDMTTGDVRQAMLPKLRVSDNGQFDKPFGWAGNAHLFGDAQLYDPQFPQPVWDYHGTEHVQFRGGRVWACVRPPAGTTVTLREFDLPHLPAQAHLASAKARAGVFALKPGSGVRIDVSAVPDDRRAEAKAALEARLREIGYVPDTAAHAVLVASVDQTPTKTSTRYGNGDLLGYTKRSAKLRLVVGNRDVWSEAWAVEPPFTASVPAGVSLADYLQRAGVGEPNYRLFAAAPLPSHVPGPGTPTAAFGATELTAGGFKDR